MCFSRSFYCGLTLYAGDADESWPNDLTDKPPIRPSKIASKSVTSLGRILECVEKRTWSTEEHDIAKKAGDDKILQRNEIMKKIDLLTEKHGTMSSSNEPLIKESIETSTTEGSFTKSDSKIPKENYMAKTTKFKEPQADSGESEYQQTTSADRTDHEEIYSQKSPALSVNYSWSKYLILTLFVKKTDWCLGSHAAASIKNDKIFVLKVMKCILLGVLEILVLKAADLTQPRINSTCIQYCS